jgi:hypothetical protein
MVDTAAALRNVSVLCFAVVFMLGITGVTALIVNVMIRAFIHLWKKTTNTGKTLDRLAAKRISRSSRRQRRVADRKPMKINVLQSTRQTKQGTANA